MSQPKFLNKASFEAERFSSLVRKTTRSDAATLCSDERNYNDAVVLTIYRYAP